MSNKDIINFDFTCGDKLFNEPFRLKFNGLLMFVKFQKHKKRLEIIVVYVTRELRELTFCFSFFLITL